MRQGENPKKGAKDAALMVFASCPKGMRTKAILENQRSRIFQKIKLSVNLSSTLARHKA